MNGQQGNNFTFHKEKVILMLIGMMTHQKFKPESLPFARPEGVVINFNHSQAFSFEGINMGKFKRMGAPLCACGCKERVKSGNRFLHGHNARDENNPMYGKTGKSNPRYGYKYTKKQLQELSKKMSGKNHPFYGKKRPEHAEILTGRKRPNHSKWMRENSPRLGKFGKDSPCYGQKRSKEFCEDQSKKLKENNPNSIPEVQNAQSRYMLNGGAAYANSFVKNPSKPQIELFKLVKLLHPEAILNYPSLNRSIDIAIPDQMIAIEYDGSYWHQDQEADLKRQKELENIGWKFLRYEDHVPSINELKGGLKRRKHE